MLSAQQLTKKSVTIIYGSTATERDRILDRKIFGKNAFELSDIQIDGKNVSGPRKTDNPIDIFVYAGLAIDPVKSLIESKEMNINYIEEIKKNIKYQLICSIASLANAEIEYLKKMDHVDLIACR